MVARRSASCRLSVGRASERRWVTRISSLLGSLDALPEKSYPVLADDDVIYKPSFLSWLIAAQSVDHAASFSYYVYRTGGLSVGQGCDGFSFWKPNLACITDLARAHVAETAPPARRVIDFLLPRHQGRAGEDDTAAGWLVDLREEHRR
jgi:hypothetical protein